MGMGRERMKKTADALLSKAERVLNGVARWASFYRANPHRFAKDYYRYAKELMESEEE